MHHSSGDGRRHKHDVRDERHQRPEVLDIAGACDYRRASLLALVIDLDSVVTSGSGSTFVVSAGSTMVGRPLEERSSDSDSD
eukprot:5629325-Pleurochrysis_carterae.AAC.1